MFLFFTSRKYSVTDDILLFCIIFVHPALADKMAESPELFDTAFTLQERLDIPDGFVQREMVYISILLGTLVLCLFFFFMQRQMKKLRERDRERYLQLLEGILDNLPIAAKVKDVNDGMRYTFGIKGRGTLWMFGQRGYRQDGFWNNARGCGFN